MLLGITLSITSYINNSYYRIRKVVSISNKLLLNS
jgi:hypothetical protein